MMHALYRWLIARHFTAALPALVYRWLHAHVESCTDCRGLFARHLEWEALLPDGEQRAGDRMWRQAEAVAQPERRSRATWGLSLAGVAAAAAVLLITLRTPETPPTLQPRGEEPVSRLELLVRDQGTGRLVAPAAVIASGSELAFRVDNAEGFAFLLLVILDSGGEVHLLYPAQNGQTGLPLATYTPGTMLPDAFTPALPAGAFRAVALFSSDAVSVDLLEQSLVELGTGRAAEALAARGRLQQITGQVAPAAVADGGR